MLSRQAKTGRSRIVGASLLVMVVVGWGVSCSRRAPKFENTFESPQALAAAVVQAAQSRDRDALRALALSEEEFRDSVFPEMPSFGKIPLSYVWGDLRQKSNIQIARLVSRSGAWDFEVEGVAFDGGATAYDTFVVHRDPRLTLVNRSTHEKVEAALFGSVIEVSGRFKLFSYVVNR